MVSGVYKIVLFLAFVVSGDKTLTDRTSIKLEEAVWQKYGLMDMGSVWGHGTVRGMACAQLDRDRANVDTRVISELRKRG